MRRERRNVAARSGTRAQGALIFPVAFRVPPWCPLIRASSTPKTQAATTITIGTTRDRNGTTKDYGHLSKTSFAAESSSTRTSQSDEDSPEFGRTPSICSISKRQNRLQLVGPVGIQPTT